MKKSKKKPAAKKPTIRKDNFFIRMKKKVDSFLRRRPHRSFRVSRRRDYSRTLELPGYWAFTSYVRKTLWKNRKVFISLTLAYILLTLVMVGVGSQETYSSLNDVLVASSGDIFKGFWGEIGKSSLLFASVITGVSSGDLSEAQQIYGGLILLLTWLTTIWLLRNILAGRKVNLRDGIYSAGSPIVSTFLVLILILMQMIPIALALVGYGAALSTGLLDGGVEAMLFWIAAGLLAVLSLYWVTGTIFAMVIVTLPGMYPMKAIRAAGDLVVGRRVRILFRLLWMIFGICVIWALVMIPIITFDSYIKNIWLDIEWLPIVPIAILFMSSISIVWMSSYIYLFYRKVVADESAPA